MHNLLVQLAGIVALATSVAHGVIGETKVFRSRPHRAAASKTVDAACVASGARSHG